MTRADVGWRPAGPSDAAYVDALVRADALVTLAGVSEPARSQLAALQVTARRFGYASAWPGAEEQIVTVDGTPVGRLLVDRAPGRVHLVDVRIDAEHRSRGIGSALLARLCAEADRAGDDLTLSVDPASPAVRLYERAGFVAAPGAPGDLTTVVRRPVPVGPRRARADLLSVTLFTLGGTIAMAGTGPAPDAPDAPDAGSGVTSRLTGAQLTDSVPGLAELGFPLVVRDLHAAPSASLTFAQLLDAVQQASAAVAEGASGVVVTQGTDTLEETAFLVDLVWPHPEPFVLTGAMRNPTLAGHDGPANIVAAVQVAAALDARDLGAVVVFNDEIHAARWVRKEHSTSTATFRSPNLGPVGHVVEGQVRVLARPHRRTPVGLPASADALDSARVALYFATLDDDGAMLDGVAERYQGLVVAGFGAGHVPAALAPALGAIAERIPVVLTSRTGSGSVLRSTYGAPGSEIDLLGRGLVYGGLLDPAKAKVLLRLLLASGADRDEIRASVAEHA